MDSQVKIMLLRNLVNLLSPLNRLCRPRRILPCRNGIYQERLRATSDLLIPIRQDLIQALRQHSMRIHAHCTDSDTQRLRCFHSSGKGILFTENPVSRLRQHSKRKFPRRRRTDRHRTAPILIRRIMDDFCMLHKPSQKLSSSMSLAVLSSGSDIEARLAQRHVVHADGHVLALDVSILLLGAVAQPRSLERNLVKRKVLAGRQAASNGNQARGFEIGSSVLERAAASAAALI